MSVIKFIHAADLHLDAPFSGLSQNAPLELINQLKTATYLAFERLIDLCRLEKPDFLILAGDTYNQEDYSLKAQLTLRDACVKLQTWGITVYVVQGNHDPLSSRLQSLTWPDNVIFFGAEVETAKFYKQNQLVATIYGVSHNSAKETRNLAKQFKRTADSGLHLGILHTTLGESDGQNRYAPCSIEDLKASGLDYFALGHVHDHKVICQEPLCIYPGCSQGLHINEYGPKGCLLVEATPHGAGFNFNYSLQPLAPIMWQSLDLDLEKTLSSSSQTQPNPTTTEISPRFSSSSDSNSSYDSSYDSSSDSSYDSSSDSSYDSSSDSSYDSSSDSNSNADASSDADSSSIPKANSPTTLDQLDLLLHQALEQLESQGLDATLHIIGRIRILGRTVLDAKLRDPQVQTTLMARLQEQEGVWIKDLQIHTKPSFDPAFLLERADMVGEIFRLAQDLELRTLSSKLAPLYEHAKARKVLEPLTEAELSLALADAKNLCLNLLEND